MGALRAGAILVGFAGLTVPLLPVQEVLVRLASKRARTFPHWYHRKVCALLGIKIHVTGEIASDQPVLLVSNHTSWLDIPVLSAVAPVSFVAKREVRGWPGVAILARLQRTVFVDRERRAAISGTANEIRSRLSEGDTLVLFAEGTSSDGNRVLPFMSSLFAALIPPRSLRSKPQADDPAESDVPNAGSPDSVAGAESVVVQTLTLAYIRRHGIPLGRAGRGQVGWYGNMEMTSHAWSVLKAGPLDVEIRIGPPVPVRSFKDRKELARHTENEVRKNLAGILRRRDPGDPFEVATPADEVRKSLSLSNRQASSRTGMR